MIEASYRPPVVSKAEGPIAALTSGTLSGGVNWPGSAYDPELHTFFTHACSACISPLGLVAPPKDFSDLDYVMGTAGQTFRPITGGGEGEAADAPRRPTPTAPPPPPTPPPAAAGAAGGRGGAAPAGGGGFGATVQGLSIVKPPYGVIAAINLDRGDLVWSVAHGDTPDNVRNHPLLRGVNVPKTGQSGNVGVAVTKTLVVAGDPSVTTTPEHPRGAMLRAYDKTNGKEVGAVWIAAPQSDAPMTYLADGKQYIVVAISGGNYSGEYVALTLPNK